MLLLFEFSLPIVLEKWKFNNPGCSRKLVLEINHSCKRKRRINKSFKMWLHEEEGRKSWGCCSVCPHPSGASGD